MEIGAEISKNIKVSGIRIRKRKHLSGLVVSISLSEVMRLARLAKPHAKRCLFARARQRRQLDFIAWQSSVWEHIKCCSCYIVCAQLDVFR